MAINSILVRVQNCFFRLLTTATFLVEKILVDPPDDVHVVSGTARCTAISPQRAQGSKNYFFAWPCRHIVCPGACTLAY